MATVLRVRLKANGGAAMNEGTFEMMVRMAMEFYGQNGAHEPMVIGFDGDGGVFPIVLANWEETAQEHGTIAAMAPMLRALLKKHRCRSYFMAMEAWAKRLNGRPDDGTRASKSPDRIEVLSIIAVLPDGSRRSRIIEIDRGKVIGPVEGMAGEPKGWPFELLA